MLPRLLPLLRARAPLLAARAAAVSPAISPQTVLRSGGGGHGPGILGPVTGASLAGAAAIWVAAHTAASVAKSRRRGLFVKRRKKPACPRCSGFGIERCTMCYGDGIVISAYPREIIPCPRCVKNRYVKCRMCAGTGARRPGLVGGGAGAFGRVPLVAAGVAGAVGVGAVASGVVGRMVGRVAPAVRNALRGAAALVVARGPGPLLPALRERR